VAGCRTVAVSPRVKETQSPIEMEIEATPLMPLPTQNDDSSINTEVPQEHLFEEISCWLVSDTWFRDQISGWDYNNCFSDGRCHPDLGRLSCGLRCSEPGWYPYGYGADGEWHTCDGSTGGETAYGLCCYNWVCNYNACDSALHDCDIVKH